jgi:ATP-binding cassette subfamily B protein
MTEHKKNINTMLDILEMEPLVKSGVRKITQDEFQKLELKNVSFTYPGSDKNVIHNMNLIIEKPMNLAIVGLNGAGKTTLLKLITRVYDPTEGEILVNGINLKEYDLDDWKRCMGILLQEYSLYAEETIVENVMLGDVTKHDMDLVIHSAQQTTADVFIQELPEKYEQRVGTEFRGGVELSKGQKQKLALARVLYRNAPIIILDEPTAAIDALSEDTIFKSLRENHTDQTRIIISHKFSNVRDADTIILVEHGTIIEQGSHSELMSINNGRYKELFELQAEGYK